METIRVHSDFHSAHRQLRYPGKCRHVHGHTWKGTIVITTEKFPRNDLDLFIDFGDLKDVLRRLDHKMLVCQDDKTFVEREQFEPEGVVVIPGRNPSVENVAYYCLNGVIDVIKGQYPDRGVKYHVEVTIQETDNNVFVVDSDTVI